MEYKNQVDIIRIAGEYLKPEFEADKVNNDWITFFFDKVKNVTEDYMKEIWGRILAGEFNNSKTYTKQLLHTMSIMDGKIATSFQRIRKCCFSIYLNGMCLYIIDHMMMILIMEDCISN